MNSSRIDHLQETYTQFNINPTGPAPSFDRLSERTKSFPRGNEGKEKIVAERRFRSEQIAEREDRRHYRRQLGDRQRDGAGAGGHGCRPGPGLQE